jgi:hypothetical protein
MKVRFSWVACFALIASGTALCQSKTPPPPPHTDNRELMQMFMDDQHDRGNEPIVEYDEHGIRITPLREWKQLPDNELGKHDAARQTRVHEMLNTGLCPDGPRLQLRGSHVPTRR